MATYYVKLAADGGNDSLAGTSPSTAWATIGKALGATGISSGDTVYIAPGTYNESVTIGMANPTAETFIIGDPTASQFPGMAAGPVYHSAWNAAGTTQITSGVLITGTTKNYLHFQNIWWSSDAANMVVLNTSRYAKFTRCQWVSSNKTYQHLTITSPTSQPVDLTLTRCAFVGSNKAIVLTGTNTTDATSITDSLFISNSHNIDVTNSNFSSFNCTFFDSANGVIQRANTTGTASFVRNSLFLSYSNFAIQATGAGTLTENYNRLLGSGRSNVSAGANSVSTGAQGVDYTYLLNQGMNYQQIWTSLQGGPNIAFGTATGAPATDLYGVTWTGASPDAGSGAYRIINSTPSQIAYNGGNERNASTITIAPGSTSQSIELYLGATGLTASTSGLSAYYNRTRTADVQIPLVARTIAQAWTSGGFAEVNASTMPGVYRLDLPDAAVAAGADDVTVVVRGASGTNGAVMTIKLSSGGLTAAQTAQAVLDAVASTHNNIGSIGAFIQDKTGYSLSTSQTFNTTGSVGSVAGNVTGNVVGTVGGVAGNVTGNIAGSVGTVANPDNIIDAVWDEQRTGHTASGSFGEKLQTNALADEMLARDLGSGLNAGTAEERTVRSALRALRNKVNVGSSQMVVKKEDDSTDAWTATVTTTAVSSNVSGIDPN